MSQAHDPVHLLGPQRLRPTLRPALDEAQVGSRIATITAGWEEREGEDDELRAHVAREVVDLRVWGRFEDVFRRDPGLFDAMQERYEAIRRVHRLYKRQLGPALETARTLLRESFERAEGAPEDAFLERACRDAIDVVRGIDARHGEELAAIHRDFAERHDLATHSVLQEHRDELRGVLEGCDALCIAGGHVGILLNRMRALTVLEIWGARPIFAWSAGAMALTEQVLLFHDRPPQGAGDAEFFDVGTGHARGLVLLPHATRRLTLDDKVRVALLARRCAPRACIALDDGARLRCVGDKWQRVEAARTLELSGEVHEMQELHA